MASMLNVVGDGSNTLFNHAYGALLGVFVGDAAGATLEFYGFNVTEETATKAMKMPGGGNLLVGPGQVTDDSELAIALALALSTAEASPGDPLPLDAIASRYVEWYASNPFDIGRTCMAAFGGTWYRMKDGAEVPNLAEVMRDSAERSMESEANGALMRIAPLPIWMAARGSDPTIIADSAKEDALLSHPNPVCQECNAVYALTLAHLLMHPGDQQGAVRAAEEYAADHMHTIAKRWLLHDSAQPEVVRGLDCRGIRCGHVRYAFTLAFHFLRRGDSFEESIRQTLVKGGDTDTNAAIVGGLLGALHGADAIPTYMKQPVLQFDCSAAGLSGGHNRPAIYSTRRARDLVLGLLRQ